MAQASNSAPPPPTGSSSLLVAMKLVDIDVDFVEVVGCGLGDAVGAFKARVMVSRLSDLGTSIRANQLAFFHAGAEMPRTDRC